jgi:ketopantoate reductase
MPAATKAEILLVGFGAVGVVYAYLLEQVRPVAPLL